MTPHAEAGMRGISFVNIEPGTTKGREPSAAKVMTYPAFFSIFCLSLLEKGYRLC